jgi:hypothetical protein
MFPKKLKTGKAMPDQPDEFVFPSTAELWWIRLVLENALKEVFYPLENARTVAMVFSRSLNVHLRWLLLFRYGHQAPILVLEPGL